MQGISECWENIVSLLLVHYRDERSRTKISTFVWWSERTGTKTFCDLGKIKPLARKPHCGNSSPLDPYSSGKLMLMTFLVLFLSNQEPTRNSHGLLNQKRQITFDVFLKTFWGSPPPWLHPDILFSASEGWGRGAGVQDDSKKLIGLGNYLISSPWKCHVHFKHIDKQVWNACYIWRCYKNAVCKEKWIIGLKAVIRSNLCDFFFQLSM